MPYYCTVPRCTSMAGKAKNVSFHQFPRDEELARLWNDILKRGKPYTKYSKVCSLHFKPEDYTITSVGKNKGQWRTLRKDAIPSQNLPSDSPIPTTHHRSRNSGAWVPSNLPSNILDQRMQQQMAQAIYMQTMLAMQVASNGSQLASQNVEAKNSPTSPSAHPSSITISDIEQILQNRKHTYPKDDNITKDDNTDAVDQHKMNGIQQRLHLENNLERVEESRRVSSYKCQDCSKCFKDPDVFVLHRRSHTTKNPEIQESLPDSLTGSSEKENLNSNSDLSRQETLRANPILANLLKSGISTSSDIPDVVSNGVFDTNNILSIENQIMTALAANMENYIRNLSTMLSNHANDHQDSVDSQNSVQEGQISDDNSVQEDQQYVVDDQNSVNSPENVQDPLLTDTLCQNINEDNEDAAQENRNCIENNLNYDDHNHVQEDNGYNIQDAHNNIQDAHNIAQDGQDSLQSEGSIHEEREIEPNCDNEDLNDSKDSSNLIIDENL